MSDITDKELLELAAKAAGIRLDYSRFNGGGTENTGFDLAGNAVLDWHNYKTWNPLTDDGDALRLAVRLRLSVSMFDDAVGIGVKGAFCYREYDITPDPNADTRRAIVRAAAEIGKAMP